MTYLDVLPWLVMPAGALVLAGLGLLWVRTWDDHKPHPGE